MQTYNTIYKTAQEFETFLRTIDTTQEESILVQIFSGVLDRTKLKEVIVKIKEIMCDAVIIGASTAGEILDGSMLDQTIIVSISVFRSTQLIAMRCVEKESFAIGETLAKGVTTDTTKAIIVFADGLGCNGEAILQGMHQNIKKDTIIAGGMAGDNNQFIQTFVIHDTEIFENGAVAVSLNSTSLHVHNSYNLAWKPIGSPMTVTKAEKNCIYEIDNKPVMEIYKEYLGEEVTLNMPDSIIEFPLIFQKGALHIARSTVAINQDCFTYAGEIPQGTDVRFGVASAFLFDQEAKKLYTINENVPLESLFVYSCTARKSFLGKGLELEFAPLATLAPVSGFFTYGELYSEGTQHHMLNITTTVLGLSESDTLPTHQKELPPFVNRTSLSTTALIHLVEKSIAQLEKESQEKQTTIAFLEQYQQAIETSYIVSKADLKGKITYVNQLFCDLSGYTKEELIGQSHNLIRHPDMPVETFEQLWRTITSKHIWRGIVQNRHKNGTSYYVDATIFPLVDKDGKIIEYVSIRDDITDIKAQKERAEAILNAQESIILLTSKIDKTMQVKHLNQKFFDVFDYKDMDDFLSQHSCICDLFLEREGYLQKDMEGKSWLEVLLEDSTKAHLVLMLDKNQQQRVFSVKAKKISLETENFIISTFSDVTELETARVKARSAEEAKSVFLATMSHELRTPLNSIIGFSQILMHKEDMPYATIKGFIEKINFSGKHLLNLVNNILDFSKIESGKMELHVQKLALDTLLHESILLVETLAQAKDITIHTLNCEQHIIYVDAQLIKQVIVNLLSNAIKFSPAKSEIVIRYTLVSNQHHIQICDQGIGLSQEQISKLFQSFSQVKEHQTEAIKGTGLGLAISKKIVELHHGKIEVQSQVGEGSCFNIYLPKETK